MDSKGRLIENTGSGREIVAALPAVKGHASEEWSRRTLRKAALSKTHRDLFAA
jgi:hypothetical protein